MGTLFPAISKQGGILPNIIVNQLWFLARASPLHALKLLKGGCTVLVFFVLIQSFLSVCFIGSLRACKYFDLLLATFSALVTTTVHLYSLMEYLTFKGLV